MVEVSSVIGRLTVLDYPVALPAHCGLCGITGQERKYLDLRLDFEDYGALIFCEECVMSMAQVFGYIKPVQARELEARVEEAERELIQTRALLTNLGSLRVSLDALGLGAGDAPITISHVAFDSVDKPDEGSTGEDTGESDELPDSEQSDSDKSSDESGSDDTSESESTNSSFLSL